MEHSMYDSKGNLITHEWTQRIGRPGVDASISNAHELSGNLRSHCTLSQNELDT